LNAPLRLMVSTGESVLLACDHGTLLLEGGGAEAAALEPGDLAVLAPAPGGDRCLLKPADSSAAALAFIAGIRT
jgi:hypothetical protein